MQLYFWARASPTKPMVAFAPLVAGREATTGWAQRTNTAIVYNPPFLLPTIVLPMICLSQPELMHTLSQWLILSVTDIVVLEVISSDKLQSCFQYNQQKSYWFNPSPFYLWLTVSMVWTLQLLLACVLKHWLPFLQIWSRFYKNFQTICRN